MTSVLRATPRYRRANAVDEAKVVVTGVGATHALQDCVVAGLHGQVDVFADRWQFRYGADDAVAHEHRMRCEEPDALEVGNVREGIQQVRQIGRVGQIGAIGVHCLAQQRHLLHSPIG